MHNCAIQANSIFEHKAERLDALYEIAYGGADDVALFSKLYNNEQRHTGAGSRLGRAVHQMRDSKQAVVHVTASARTHASNARERMAIKGQQQQSLYARPPRPRRKAKPAAASTAAPAARAPAAGTQFQAPPAQPASQATTQAPAAARATSTATAAAGAGRGRGRGAGAGGRGGGRANGSVPASG